MVTATEPIGRMTRLPEWLDFLAASAVLAFAGGLGWQSGLFALVVNALRVTL
jgi:protein-L-isoaspartate O-methyltransferase